MRYKFSLISIFSLIILVILGSFRWEQREVDANFSYKYDRWAKQLWVEYNPPIGITDGIDIPILYIDKLSNNEVESYLEKLGVTGQAVNVWVYRVRLSDAYIGLLILNIIVILLAFKNIVSRRIPRYWSSPN